MKSRVIDNCRYIYDMLVEKIMEFADYMKYAIRRSDEYKSNLVEIYRIKEKYLNNDFVQNFLKERQRNIAPDRYRIEVRADHVPGDEEIVGEVMLMRKDRLIERAQLITKPNIPDSEKLVYWKF